MDGTTENLSGSREETPAARKDTSAIFPIYHQLNTYMVHASNSMLTNEDFWRHEWRKHGVCSGKPQLQYFTEAIDAFKRLKRKLNSIVQTLNAMRQNGPTTPADVRAVVHNEFGVWGEVQCNYGAHTVHDESKVIEIRVRVNHNGQLDNYSPKKPSYRGPYTGFSGDCTSHAWAAF